MREPASPGQVPVGKSLRRSRTGGRRRALHEARLDRLIEDATLDTHNESEQRTGFHAALEDHLQLPFETMVLGVPVARVASIPDLIHLKRLAGRPQDLADIERLESILEAKKKGEDD